MLITRAISDALLFTVFLLYENYSTNTDAHNACNLSCQLSWLGLSYYANDIITGRLHILFCKNWYL